MQRGSSHHQLLSRIGNAINVTDTHSRDRRDAAFTNNPSFALKVKTDGSNSRYLLDDTLGGL
jgi:hypothetical protein